MTHGTAKLCRKSSIEEEESWKTYVHGITLNNVKTSGDWGTFVPHPLGIPRVNPNHHSITEMYWDWIQLHFLKKMSIVSTLWSNGWNWWHTYRRCSRIDPHHPRPWISYILNWKRICLYARAWGYGFYIYI